MVPYVQLRSFLEVHSARSFTKASESLGLAQPSITNHIKSLETKIGKQLFVRNANGAEPTICADELAERIKHSFDSLEQIFVGWCERSEQKTGALHIAGPVEFLGHHFVRPISELSRLGFLIQISFGDNEFIYECLEQNTVDLAVTASRPSSEYLYSELDVENLVPVASPDWCNECFTGKIPFEGLQDVPAIGNSIRNDLVRQYFPDKELSPPNLVVPNLEVASKLAVADAGWTVLPHYLVRDFLACGKLVDLSNGESHKKTEIYLAWSRNALRTKRIVEARNVILDAFGKLNKQ